MAESVADTLNSARESMQEAAVSLSGEAHTAVASFGSRVQGAKINVWGVGTNLITAKDQPALDGVYKRLSLI